MKDELVIHTDGGARGNPGPAACAFVAEVSGKLIEQKSKYLNTTTNNFAEYQGVILALNWLNGNKNILGLTETITFYLDSELIVRQIVGVYKVRDEKLRDLYLEVFNLIKKTNKKILFKNVPRSQNKEADLLVNKELDSQH